jgi:hypothetical protein
MKRCLLAAALVTCFSFSVASADYIIIKIDLNQPLPGENQAGASAPGRFGGAPGGDMPAGGGGMVGGKGGLGGGFPGGGIPGAGSGYPGAGSGYPGAGSGYPGAGSGVPGMQGGRPGGKGGMGGGFPGGGFPGGGFPGGGGDYGATDQTPPPETVPDKAPMYVYACLELDLKHEVDGKKTTHIFGFDTAIIDHRLAKKIFIPYSSVASYVRGAPISARFAAKFNKLKEDKAVDPETRKERLLDLADMALKAGLLTRFNEVIDELKKQDPKHAVVAAVERTRKELAKAPKIDDPAALTLMEELKKEGYRTLNSGGGHYTFLTNVSQSGARDDELQKKMNKMEEVYSAFFYWFALKAEPKVPPAHRLTVVVVDTPYNNPKDFDVKQAVFNHIPMVDSGFTAQRDNVVIVASRRTDEAFSTLQYNNHMRWENYKVSPKELLLDTNIFKHRGGEIGKEIPIMQTMALLQKAMDEEGEMTTLSHEGIRQLVAATGILPRTVATAEWARFGLASFFEVPHYAFYPSIGGPSWEYLATFKALRVRKKLEAKDAKEILLKVVGDEYFHPAYDAMHKAQEAKAKNKDKDQRQILQMKADIQLEMARATSWSLMYYLMRNKKYNEALQRYFQAVADLPRDMDYDSKVLKECFLRAFGLLMQDPDAPGRQMVNVNNLESLASAWLSSIDETQQDLNLLGEELKKKVLEDQQLRDKIIAKLQEPRPPAGDMGQPGYPGIGPGGNFPGGSGYGPGGAGSGYGPGGAGRGGAGSGYGPGGAGSGVPPPSGNPGAGSGYGPGGKSAGPPGKGIN